MIELPLGMEGSAAWQIRKMAVMLVSKVFTHSSSSISSRVVGHLERRVVDQDVDAPELADGLFDDVVAVLFLRQVSGQQQALTACRLNPARGFLRVFMLIQIAMATSAPSRA
jgi:hypothetical protein